MRTCTKTKKREMKNESFIYYIRNKAIITQDQVISTISPSEFKKKSKIKNKKCLHTDNFSRFSMHWDRKGGIWYLVYTYYIYIHPELGI